MLINFNDLFLLSSKVNGIIHIGAHNLEELPDYLKGNVRRIIWIEANPEKYNFIEERLKRFENMTLGKFAAGRKNGFHILNLANNGQSSSLLEFGTHKMSYPDIDYVSKIQVETKPLDDWLDENFKNKDQYNFINIDIQGAELKALQGCTKILEKIDAIYTEINFEELYEDCVIAQELDDFLKKFNFKRVLTNTPQDPSWGDALYIK